MTNYRYVLFIEFDGEHPIVSMHASIAKAEAAWRKFCAEFFAVELDLLPRDADLVDVLVENHRLVDCRIFACHPDGSEADWFVPFREEDLAEVAAEIIKKRG
jgi:hypothetical protein